jgi:hypothetical protein
MQTSPKDVGYQASGNPFSKESVRPNLQVSKNIEFPRADQLWMMDTN